MNPELRLCIIIVSSLSTRQFMEVVQSEKFYERGNGNKIGAQWPEKHIREVER